MKLVTEKMYNAMSREEREEHEAKVRLELIELGLIKPKEDKI